MALWSLVPYTVCKELSVKHQNYGKIRLKCKKKQFERALRACLEVLRNSKAASNRPTLPSAANFLEC